MKTNMGLGLVRGVAAIVSFAVLECAAMKSGSDVPVTTPPKAPGESVTGDASIVPDGTAIEGDTEDASLLTDTTESSSSPSDDQSADAPPDTAPPVVHSCPSVVSISTESGEAKIGAAIALSASATSDEPTALHFAWSAAPTIGAFVTSLQNGGSEAISFLCTSPGIATIALAVTDGLPGEPASCGDGSFDVPTLQVTCEAEPPHRAFRNFRFLRAIAPPRTSSRARTATFGLRSPMATR